MTTVTSSLSRSLFGCLLALLISISCVNGTSPVTVCVNQTLINSSCNKAFSELHSALVYALNFSSYVTVSIYPGTYILSLNTTITSVRWFYIEGEIANTVIVECVPDAGISFVNSSNVWIQNLHIKGCGARHDFDTNHTIFASLFFFSCTSVFMHNVQVVNGTGVGAVFHATNGTNIIHSSLFENNHLPKDNSSYYGGGLQIGFPQCALDDTSSQCSPVPLESMSSSLYNITNCSFVGNSGLGNSRPDRMDSPHKASLSSNLSYFFEQSGGGLMIFFLGNAALSNTIHIEGCSFARNYALYGGGVYIAFSDNSTNNRVQILHSNFINNSVAYEGGGVRLNYSSMDKDYGNNSCHFHMCRFENNTASVGGGVSISASKQLEPGLSASTNFLGFIECLWFNNSALVGSAISANVWYPLSIGVVPAVELTSCNFTKNNVSRYEKQGELAGVSTVSLDSMPLHIAKSVVFHGNDGTCIFSVNSEILFLEDCTSTFDNNVASRGGVFSLLASAFITVYSDTIFYFTRNQVSNFGGVLYGYTLSPNDYISLVTSSNNCVLRYFDPELHPAEWKTEFHFLNNTGNQDKPDSIYLTTLLPCVWVRGGESMTDLIQKVFCWSEKWDYGGDRCENQIRSAPSHLSINSTFLSTAGKTTPLYATAYDDQHENITEDLILTVDSDTHDNIHIPQPYHFISNNQIQVHQHTLNDSEKSFHLLSAYPRILQANVKVQMAPCPPAYELNSVGSCECRSYHNYIQCDPAHWNATIRRSYWIGTYRNQSTAGYCILCHNDFNYTVGDYTAIPVYENDSSTYLCPNNRRGTLCSECNRNYGVSATAIDFRCVYCPDNLSVYMWLIRLLYHYVPSTVMILLLFITNFSLASGPLNAAIFFAQMITTSMDITQNGVIPVQGISDSVTVSKALLDIYNVVYGIWSLDFFKPFLADFCLSQHLRVSDVIALRYLGAFFPMLFVGAILAVRYLDNMNATLIVKIKDCLFSIRPLKQCIDKFSARMTLAVSSSLQNVVASCIILVYTRCVIVTSQLLNYVPLRGRSDTVVAYFPKYDPFTEYFEGRHKLYFVLGLVMTATFLIPVPFSLLFFRYNKSTVNKSYFHIFLESFQREFKCTSDKHPSPSLSPDPGREYFQLSSTIPDTLPPTSFWRKNSCCNPFDYRWMAGVYFALRSFMVLSSLAPTPMLGLFFQQVLCIVMATIILVAHPYTSNWNNKLDCCILLLMVVINGITIYQYFLTLIGTPLSLPAFSVQYVLIYIPLLWISIYVIATMFQACVRKRRTSSYISETTSTAVLTDAVGAVTGVENEERALLRPGNLLQDFSTVAQYSRFSQTNSKPDPELAPLLEPSATESDADND